MDTVIHPGSVNFIPPVLYHKMFTESSPLSILENFYSFLVIYRQSNAFSVAREGESHKMTSESGTSRKLCLLDVNISVIRTAASDKEQDRRKPWYINAPYRLQHVQFVASRLETSILRFASCVSRRKSLCHVLKTCLQQRTLFVLQQTLFCID